MANSPKSIGKESDTGVAPDSFGAPMTERNAPLQNQQFSTPENFAGKPAIGKRAPAGLGPHKKIGS